MKSAKSIIIVGFVIIGLILVFQFGFFVNAKSNGENVYTITVNSGSENEDSYMTTKYEIDGECIKFKDMIGFNHTICGHYTITEY